MNKILSGITGTVVLNEFTDGVNVVQSGTPLKFVNYFDGMLMRAETMKLEQQGHFNLSQLSNQAGGHGVVWGYDTALSDGNMELGSGMAMNADGRIVYLPGAIELSIEELINKASNESVNAGKADGVFEGFAECKVQEPSDSVTIIEGTQYYVITVDNLNALCGEDDVYGKLCEEACVSATDRPYQLNGVVVRAEALPTGLLLPQSSAVTLSGTHLRSRIASAYYEYEKNSISSQISGEGLAQGTWCNGARLPGGFTRGVPVALLARQGSETLFLDRWIVTRERMESPPRNYWAQVMAMRPWNQFLAQVLQFQCQINNLFGGDGAPVNPDPCAGTKEEIKNLSTELEKILAQYQSPKANETAVGEAAMVSLEELKVSEKDEDLISKVQSIQTRLAEKSEPVDSNQNRILINGGIVETPSAGYLPVSVDAQLSVNEQVRNLMGEGVDLKFCVVRPDFIPHALEEAQHMERISLLQGLDDPSNKPKVDVLVPNGYFGEVEQSIQGTGYEMQLELYSSIGFIVDAMVPKEFASSVEEAEISFSEEDAAVAARAMKLSAAEAYQPGLAAIDNNKPLGIIKGVARGANTESGGYSFAFAGIGNVTDASDQSKRDRLVGVTEIDDLAIETQVRKVGFWTDMMVAKDPSSMQIGESTTTTIEIDMVANIEGQSRLRFESNLNVKVTDKFNDTVQIQLTGEARTRLIKTSIREKSIIVDRTASVKRGDLSGLSAVIASTLLGAVVKGQSGITLSALRQYQNNTTAKFSLIARMPSNAKARAELAEVGLTIEPVTALEIAQAKQVVSSDVFNPSHPFYEASYEGLNLISSFANQADLTEIRANRLFDTDSTFQQGDQVFAEKDWVFFHRRRDKVCAQPTSVTQPVDRSYRVFTVEARSEKVAGSLLKELSASNWDVLSQVKFTEITDINYLANSASLKTSQQGILSDWNLKVSDNVKIHSGVIANNPQWQESASLAQARGSQLNQVVDDETQISNSDFLVLNDLPPSLSQGEQGGIIYIIEPVTTTCQSVYRLQSSNVDGVVSAFRQQMAAAKSLEELVKNVGAIYLNDLSFIEQSTALFEQQGANELIEKWAALGNEPVAATISLAQTPQTEGLVLAQSIALGQGLGTESFFEESTSTTLELGDCWGATFILPDLVSENGLYYYKGVITEPMLANMREALLSRGSEELVGDRWVSEATVRFDSDSNALDPNDLAIINKSISNTVTLPENVEWRAISVHPQGATTASSVTLEKESASIVTNLVDASHISTVTDANDSLRNGADGLTLMVPVDTSKKESVLPVAIAANDAASSSVAAPSVVFHFDEDNELIKDERFDEQIKLLKNSGVSIAEAEMVGKTKPKSNDKRLSAVFEALKENQILSSDAAKKTTKLKAEELTTLDVGSFRMAEALVLRP